MHGGPAVRTRQAPLLVVAGILVLTTLPAGAQPIPAGASAAVLSFIDAAAGRVEVVRRWPGTPTDVDVYPFVPYLWGGCPGPGAIMMLVTGIGGGPPLADRIARALEGAARLSSAPAGEITRVAAALGRPGDPAAEAVKAAAPWSSALFTYERFGYAVFLFVHWTGVGCGITLRAVPEGYGIPFVD